ncbi:MAG: hypothetical protein WCI31_17390 [Prolixibacteraceae bacterium]
MTSIVTRGAAKRNPGTEMQGDQPSAVAYRKKLQIVSDGKRG